MSTTAPRLRADEVLHALARRHSKDLWLTEVKTGPTWNARVGQLHRIDGLAVRRSWSSPCITGYEVKVSRQDWVRDEKWHAALPDCHVFYIGCPHGLIAAEEVPAEVGLIWVDQGGRRASVRRKAVHREIELSPLLLYHLVISRLESDHHPFFSDTREALEAWVQDKARRVALADSVRTRLAEAVGAAETRAREAERTAERLEEDAARWRRTVEILRAAGHEIPWSWRWEEVVQRAVLGSAPEGLERRLRDAADTIRAVADALGPGGRAPEEAPKAARA